MPPLDKLNLFIWIALITATFPSCQSHKKSARNTGFVITGKIDNSELIGLENVQLYRHNQNKFLLFNAGFALEENMSGVTECLKIFDLTPLLDTPPPASTDYQRIVMTLEIQNDPELREEYISIHAPDSFWPQIVNNMQTVGIYDMELFLHGYQAYLVMDTKPDFDMEADGKVWAELPKEKEWQAYAGKFQKVDPASKATEKWKVMSLLSENTNE